MEKFNTNDRYIAIAREILSTTGITLTLDDPEQMLLEVFEAYSKLGYYVDEPRRNKDEDVFMVFRILQAGLGVEYYKDWDEYNIFKK